MKSGPENAIKKKVKQVLDKHGIFHFCIAASPYGVGGISDRLAVLPNGRFLAIECKAPGKKPTKLQEEFLNNVNRSNGIGLVVDSIEEAENLSRYLERKLYAF